MVLLHFTPDRFTVHSLWHFVPLGPYDNLLHDVHQHLLTLHSFRTIQHHHYANTNAMLYGRRFPSSLIAVETQVPNVLFRGVSAPDPKHGIMWTPITWWRCRKKITSISRHAPLMAVGISCAAHKQEVLLNARSRDRRPRCCAFSVYSIFKCYSCFVWPDSSHS